MTFIPSSLLIEAVSSSFRSCHFARCTTKLSKLPLISIVVLVILEVWVTDIPASILIDFRIGVALDCDLFSSLQITSCKCWRPQAARIADQFSLDIDEVFRFCF